MLALWDTFVLWETLDSLVSPRDITDLLVYQTHSALNELRDELFDWEIIDYSTSSWEQIGQNILQYMSAWLGWLQSRMCFWGSAYAPETVEQKQSIPVWYPAHEGNSWEHDVWTPRKHVDSIHSFVHLIGKEPDDITCCIETCRICIEWWELIYIISCNSQNDWFPLGNCMIFMPLLECNLKSDSLFTVSDINQNDCFLEEECLPLKSLARDWFEELGRILIAIQKSEWLLSLRKMFCIYALAHD